MGNRKLANEAIVLSIVRRSRLRTLEFSDLGARTILHAHFAMCHERFLALVWGAVRVDLIKVETSIEEIMISWQIAIYLLNNRPF